MSHWPVNTDDRRLIATWAEHGIPTNDSTLEYAAQLLVRLLRAYDGLADELDQGWANPPPHPRPRPR